MCRPRAVGGPLSGTGPARHRCPQTCRGACETGPGSSCRGDRSWFGRVSVSRPIEGLDSHGAVRTLRSSLSRANGCASRLHARVGFASDDFRGREASAALARVRRIRSVQPACRLSRPSIGRDTPTPPSTERSPREDGQGSVAQAPRHVCGHRRRAGPVPESGPQTARGRHIASRPADAGRSGRRQMLEAPERPTPVQPLAEDPRASQRPCAARASTK